jgi:chorismate dehydratase
MVQKGRVRVGAVSYLNTKPLIYPLLNNSQNLTNEEIDLFLDYPSRLADDLKAGNLDVALIPIIEYFRSPGYRIVPNMSISSRGPVRSIQFFTHVPIATIRRIAFDTSSRSSCALVQIWLAEKYHLYPEIISCPPSTDPRSVDADAVLLIGDAAMRCRYPADSALDLGAEWQEFVGLPFVYACWVARENVELRNVTHILQRAKQIGINQIPEIAHAEAQKLGFPDDMCQDYLTNHIYYDLGELEIAGMMKFYELAVKYGLALPDITPKFV